MCHQYKGVTMTIDKFIKEFGNNNFARDAFFFYSFLKQHRFKKFTRAKLYKLTGLRPHRQIAIEKILKSKNFLPSANTESTTPRISPFPKNKEVAIAKPETPMATLPPKPQVTFVTRSHTTGTSLQPIVTNLPQAPPTKTANLTANFSSDDFVIQKVDENNYIATSPKYPGISINLTSFQFELASSNPLILERTFQSKVNNQKHDRIVQLQNPFAKYLEKLNDKNDNEESVEKQDQSTVKSVGVEIQQKFLPQLKERKKERSKERKKEKDLPYLENNLILNPHSSTGTGTSITHVQTPTQVTSLSTGLEEKEEKERKKEIYKEKKKEKEEKELVLQVPISQLRPDEQIEFVVREWNKMAQEVGLPKVTKINERRRASILKRLREKEFDYLTILQKIRDSDFLSGRKAEWRCDFDFVFLSSHNYIKILEGKYDNRNTPFTGRYRDFPQKVRAIYDFAYRNFGKQTTQGQPNNNSEE